MALKPRQERVLRAVVEEFIASGSPVGSRYLREHYEFEAAASTLRTDLADLEELGLLDHPHTSAGRVPTDAGYRHYVDGIARARSAPPAVPLDAARMRSEIDGALEETADALSRATELLAIVSSPSLSTTTIRHIEVLRLHPDLVMVVVITTAGRVVKRAFPFASRVDEGLAEFARVYLNERLTGVQLGTRLIESAFTSTELAPKETAFLNVLRPAFEVVVEGDAGALHLGGASRLVERLSAQGVARLNDIVTLLEQRYSLLALLSGALGADDLAVRIGSEIGDPSLQACSLVAANYGVANRHLGTVSVIGPTRMDYQATILAVRTAAQGLSSYLEEIW